ncbi:MAG: TetR family transcriptional regulator [Bacteriovorax sp.]|nr:TetR family transcriptional regulator [Bacteriovorax sp.]
MVEKVCSFFGKKIITADTRDLILDEARKHFCEKGFAGASVRDICDGAKVNVSAIKYHFGGKEGLYRECFKIYGESRLNSASKILTKANSVEELKLRIKLFCEDFIKEGLDNMYTTKMICREIETENPLIDDIFQDTFLKIYTTLTEMFEDAKAKNLIRKDLDTMIFTAAFFHNLTTSLRVNHVGEKYFKRSLRDPIYSELFINNIITIFFDGIKIQE